MGMVWGPRGVASPVVPLIYYRPEEVQPDVWSALRVCTAWFLRRLRSLGSALGVWGFPCSHLC